MDILCPKMFLFSLNFFDFKKKVCCELRKNCSAFARIFVKAKEAQYTAFFFSYKRQPKDLLSFITLSQCYYHCDLSSSFLYRQLNLPDRRRRAQRWQSVGRCVGLALNRQAGKTNLYLHFFLCCIGWC